MAITPINYQGHESSAEMKNAGGGFSQFFASTVKRPLWTCMNYLDTGKTDNAESMGAGNPEFAQINSSEIGAIYAAANDDSYGCLWLLPPELDITNEIKFRVFWCENGTLGTGSALYVVEYTEIVTETDAWAIGATALDTPITTDAPSTTDYALQATPQGVMNANTLTAGGQGVNALAIITTCTLDTIDDANAFMLEVEYDRRFVGTTY
jgi:hypothetical protein